MANRGIFLGLFAYGLLSPWNLAAAPLFISTTEALQSPTVSRNERIKYVVYKRPGYHIRLWTWISGKVLPADLAASERIITLISGTQLKVGEGISEKRGPGSIWLFPMGGKRPVWSGDPKDPAMGFSIIQDIDPKNVDKNPKKHKFARLTDLLEKFPMRPDKASTSHRFLHGAVMAAYLVQIRGTTPVIERGGGEHVLFIAQGNTVVRLPNISFGAAKGHLVVVPPQTPFSIVNRGKDKAVVLHYWIRPPQTTRTKGTTEPASGP